jgi:hypothetical protein
MEVDAIPPSSPPWAPHASTLDPPSSPFFEAQNSSFTGLKSSSPPPLFSSDDSRESIDVINYQSPRIYKNKRKGAWWDGGESAHGSAYNTPEAKKAKFSRNFDSGIYMLSDASESSDGILPTHNSPFDMDSASDNRMDDVVEQSPAVDTTTFPAIPSSAEEREFTRRLQHAVEQDLESHDFKGLGLEDQHIQRIGELDQITKPPPVHDDSLPAPGQWRSLVPEHKVFLSHNQLRLLVPALFDVQNITKLYLRNNRIEELPQDIAKLVNLEVLDVAHNEIRYLPFDLVKLLQPHGKLEQLVTFGNELLEPMMPDRFHETDFEKKEVDEDEEEEQGAVAGTDVLLLDTVREDAGAEIPHLYDSLPSSSDPDQVVWRIRYLESWATSFTEGNDDRMPEERGFYPHHPSLFLDDLDEEDVLARAPRYIARSLVSYYDQIGHLLPSSSALPGRIVDKDGEEEKYPIIIETNRGTYGTPASLFVPPPVTSEVNPLVTMTIENALRTETPEDIRWLMRRRVMPRDGEAILQVAERNAAGGYGAFRHCHVCGKEYVVARADWIEFWSRGEGVFLSVRVSVCRWSCVPQAMRQRPMTELTW